MTSNEGRGKMKSDLLSALRKSEQHFEHFRETYLQLVQRCCDRDPGNETVQNLKRATILQEIALEKYQRTVDTFTDLLLTDTGAQKPAS